MADTFSGLELRSTVTGDGELLLNLVPVTVADPADDEVVVRVEATPINPSDLGLLLGAADPAALVAGSDANGPTLRGPIPAERMGGMKPRLDQSMPVGNEGAGTVVAAGAAGAGLIGRRVGMLGGAMYTQYRKLKLRDCIPLPEGASAADGASMFVNPLTALSFPEVMRREGHTALVHTAAASNLGQMLNRICLADGIALVNIVRSDAQAQILRDLGAKHIVDSSAPDYRRRLEDSLAETGATIAFDATGGGKLANDILMGMEAAANRNAKEYSRYGSDTFKQVYIYGALDMGPTILGRALGFSWSVAGFLLTPFLQKAGIETVMRMRQRVADELTTTFASRYTATLSLAEALDPAKVAMYNRKATGEKYLIDPSA